MDNNVKEDQYGHMNQVKININKEIKEIISHSPKIYLLSYDLSLEMEIIQNLLRFNCCFYVLKIIHQDFFSFKGYRVELCSNNYSERINDIFKEDVVSDYGVIGNVGPQRSYILLLTVNKLTTNPVGEKYSYGIYRYLLKQLKSFRFCNCFFVNSVIIMVLSNYTEQEKIAITSTKKRKLLIYENKKEIKNKKIIINPLGGIGDYCMSSSLLRSLIYESENKGIDVYILLFSKIKFNFPIDIFFPNVKKLYANNVSVEGLKAISDEIVDFQDLFSVKNLEIRETVFEYTKRILDIKNNVIPYQDSKCVFSNIISYREISPYCNEFEYIDTLFQERDYIGFQYYTGEYDVRKKAWVSHAPDRCWPLDKVKRFLKLCRENNINVLLLNRNPYGEQLDAVQLKNVSLPAYFYAISKVKINVGIDSSAGHIAGLFGIPTITIWGRSTPLINHSIETSFRVLKKNYSIYSQRRSIDYIEPEVVIQVLLDWKKAVCRFDEKVITYRDSMENYMIQVVD